MPRANTHAVRISNDLIEAARTAAVASGRSIPMEIEHRLRQSFDAGGSARFSPWARVVARHIGYLAEDVADVSQSADEALVALKARASGYFDGLLAVFRNALGAHEMEAVVSEVSQDNETAGRAFARRVLLAHEGESSVTDNWAEVAKPSREPKSEQLLKDQAVLLVSPEALGKMSTAQTGQTSGKGKK